MKTILAATLLLGAWGAALAEPLNEDKPFAETHVLLQVSQTDPKRYSLALDIAKEREGQRTE